jgi:hypothetical protein
MLAAIAIAAICLGVVGSSTAALPRSIPLPVFNPTVPPDRTVEPVVMLGADFPGIAVPQNETAKAPFTDLVDCQPGGNTDNCAHNEYSPPQVDTSGGQNQLPVKGVYPSRLLGYRWQPRAHRFVQIPFQVDKVFTRYLENDASGFAIYSGADQHTTYQWQNEGFRAYPDPKDPCHALYQPPAKDPIPYFDTNDEVSFMYSDSGPRAPRGTTRPKGISAMRAIQISDPLHPGAGPSWVYVRVAAPTGLSVSIVRHSGVRRGASSDQVPSLPPMLSRMVPPPGCLIAQTMTWSKFCSGASAVTPKVSPAA